MPIETDEAWRYRDRQLPEAELDAVRDRYFPGWREHTTSSVTRRETWPLYSVAVRTKAAKSVIMAALPAGVDVAVSISPNAE
jgi:hypothetical protein